MGAVLSFAARLVSETCITCGVEFALPEARRNWLTEHKGVSFYCPNGHAQSFIGETEAEKLAKQLAAKQRELETSNYQLKNVRDLNQKITVRATRAEKKLERVTKGTCPCCNRSFTALRRHMATKHPDWKPEGEVAKK